MCGNQSLSGGKLGDPGTSLVLPSFSERPGWGGGDRTTNHSVSSLILGSINKKYPALERAKVPAC